MVEQKFNIRIDGYGRISGEPQFGAGFRRPYQKVTSDGTTYERYDSSDTEKVIIMKTVISGNSETCTFAFDLWSDRASATYVPCNDVLPYIKS